MASRIVHFGIDECHRLAVLSKAGYYIEASGDSIFSLAHLLAKEASDATAISEDHWECDSEVIEISRSLSRAPIILFEGINRKSELPAVDLAVSLLTPPSEWLNELARIIQQSKQIDIDSESIREQSAHLRERSRALRAEAASARQNAADQCLRARSNSKNRL